MWSTVVFVQFLPPETFLCYNIIQFRANKNRSWTRYVQNKLLQNEDFAIAVLKVVFLSWPIQLLTRNCKYLLTQLGWNFQHSQFESVFYNCMFLKSSQHWT